MIYVEDNPTDAKSFTDDTSLHKAQSSDRKVSNPRPSNQRAAAVLVL